MYTWLVGRIWINCVASLLLWKMWRVYAISKRAREQSDHWKKRVLFMLIIMAQLFIHHKWVILHKIRDCQFALFVSRERSTQNMLLFCCWAISKQMHVAAVRARAPFEIIRFIIEIWNSRSHERCEMLLISCTQIAAERLQRAGACHLFFNFDCKIVIFFKFSCQSSS